MADIISLDMDINHLFDLIFIAVFFAQLLVMIYSYFRHR